MRLTARERGAYDHGPALWRLVTSWGGRAGGPSAVPGLVVLESMWNKRGTLLEEEPSVLPFLKAIRQSLAWEGIRVNLVYRRFYSNYDLGLLLEEVRRSGSFSVCYIASHGQRRKLVGIGNRVIRLQTLVEHCRASNRMGFIFGAC